MNKDSHPESHRESAVPSPGTRLRRAVDEVRATFRRVREIQHEATEQYPHLPFLG